MRLVRATPPEPVLPGQDVVFRRSSKRRARGPFVHDRSRAGRRSPGAHRTSVGRATRSASRPPSATRRRPPAFRGHRRRTADRRESSADEDNAADLAIFATARTLRVAVYEPRPSWAAGFVRRALESDPVFEVSSLVRPSRGRRGPCGRACLRGLTCAALAPFDAVLVGAPEELTASEVAALDDVRAGARRGRHSSCRIAGRRVPTLRLFPSARFDEDVARQTCRRSGAGARPRSARRSLRCREASGGRRRDRLGPSEIGRAGDRFVAARRRPGDRVFGRARCVAIPRRATTRPSVGSGPGRSRTSRPPLRRGCRSRSDPALAAPGEPSLTIRAAAISRRSLRRARRAMPCRRRFARGRDGSQQFVRLWPLAEPGVFEGDGRAPACRADTRRGRRVAGERWPTRRFSSPTGVRQPPRTTIGLRWMLVAAATGGRRDATDPISRRSSATCAAWAAATCPADRHPMRSGWWGSPFAAALCGEWALRRRGGAR